MKDSRSYTGRVQKLRVDAAELGILDLKEVMVTVLTESQFRQVKRYHKIEKENGEAILLIKENGTQRKNKETLWQRYFEV